MRITLLDALPAGPVSDSVAELARETGVVRHHDLRHEKFAPCRGCFECWVEHPGVCSAKDASNDVMRDFIGADVVLWTTRVRFGCWDSIAKAALDKSIGLLSPFFATQHGETHRAKRYGRYPSWGVVAVVDRDTPVEEREAFSRLVQRNVLNLHGHEPWVGFVEEGTSMEQVRAVVRSGLAALIHERPASFVELSPFDGPRTRKGVVRSHDGNPHVTLWVGSAKPVGTSTSEVLGQALLRRLEAAGWSSEVVHAAQTVKLGRGEAPELFDAFSRADLVVIATPVYVDCLPALVLEGLAAMAQAGWGERAPSILPVVQCGFPEVVHTTLALETLHRFALDSGLGWAGHLAVGGGGTLAGRELDARKGVGKSQRQALSDAANELDAGGPLSDETIARFATPLVSSALYRIIGQVGWLAQAAGHGAVHELWDRPFPEADEAPPALTSGSSG